MTFLSQINQIKNVASAKRVYEALSASYVQQVGQKTAEHHDAMFRDGCEYKVDGLAWWKARCRSVSFNLVQKASTVNRFIPASDETLAWGGFLGGERLVYTNQADKADAEEMLSGKIAGIVG